MNKFEVGKFYKINGNRYECLKFVEKGESDFNVYMMDEQENVNKYEFIDAVPWIDEPKIVMHAPAMYKNHGIYVVTCAMYSSKERAIEDLNTDITWPAYPNTNWPMLPEIEK